MSLLDPSIIALFILILVSAFFSFAEIAYTSLSVTQINRIKRENPHLLDIWEKNPNQILATLLLSNNTVNIAIGVVSARLAFTVAEEYSWRISLVTFLVSFLSGVAVLIFGEILPKSLARYQQGRTILFISPLINMWNNFVAPLSNAAVRITNVILSWLPKRFRISGFYDDNLFKILLTHTTLPMGSHKILDNVLEFSSTSVTDVMIKKEHIFMMQLDTPISTAIQRVIRSGYSRIPIFSKEENQVVGLLYAKDLLAAGRNADLLVLADLLRPILRIPPETTLPDLLRQFRQGHHHMALVTSSNINQPLGLVTLHDALESLVGDIREEF